MSESNWIETFSVDIFLSFVKVHLYKYNTILIYLLIYFSYLESYFSYVRMYKYRNVQNDQYYNYTYI